ncbi:MAG: 5'/3'-nucleotidase SurE, partial [Actinomycetota bacterium]
MTSERVNPDGCAWPSTARSIRPPVSWGGMRVLLTNDDGIDSPGLHALAAALADTAEVVVVAPSHNQSAVARGITIRD